MSEPLYRLIAEGNTNFDFYLRHALSDDQDMPHGTIVRYDSTGTPIGFFIRVAPFWGDMYDGDTLYRRGGHGGPGDQKVGWVLKEHLFVPVKHVPIIVDKFTKLLADSEEGSGFTTMSPGRYAVVRKKRR